MPVGVDVPGTAMNITKKAFTLIELLVVISLIGLLAGLALVSFTGSQKQARDSQRQSDLKQYQNSLEVFANKNSGFYPSRLAASGVSAASTLCSDLSLTGCPEDPKNATDPTFSYRYQSDGSDLGTADATQYVLWAKIEGTSDNWVVCSNGKVGKKARTGFSVSGGACPL